MRSRSFRLLVEWCRDGKFLADWEEELSPEWRLRYHHALSQPNLSSSQLSESFSKASESAIPPPEDEWTFYKCLLLAEGLVQTDNDRAKKNDKIQEYFGLLGVESTEAGTLLNLSFVPIVILDDLPTLRQVFRQTRIDVLSSLQQFRQRTTRGQDARLVDAGGNEVELPVGAGHERLWAQQYGMERNTAELSRQFVWTLIFVPLVHALLPHATRQKRDRWTAGEDPGQLFLPDDVFKQASRLIHLRYPDHWADRWTRVRDRCAIHLK
jgi:hypothetical protein